MYFAANPSEFQKIRKGLGLTLKDLADAAGVEVTRMHRFAKGEYALREAEFTRMRIKYQELLKGGWFKMTKVRTRRSPAVCLLKYTSLLTVMASQGLGTMAAVAKKTGVSESALHYWSRGFGATISKATKLCQGLGVDFDTLWVIDPETAKKRAEYK